MRTSIDLDPTVAKELKRRSKGAGKSMGQLASELLATSLTEEHRRPRDPGGLAWIAKDLGRPLIDLEDKEAVRALFERADERNRRRQHPRLRKLIGSRQTSRSGGRRGFRTPDLQHVKLALFQLS